MKNDIRQFILNYMPNLWFLFFIFVVLVAMISAVLDTLLESHINEIIGNYYVYTLQYGFVVIFMVSAIQWIMNLIYLNKIALDKETKSRWRHYMFLWLIFGNAEFYEQVGGGKNNPHFKRMRDFLRLKSVSLFRP